jgi:signal transduction histidine kinase/CheY-like chemotaxis protein
MSRNPDVVSPSMRDLSVLYQLSLAASYSLGLSENAANFARTLLSGYGLASVSIWQKVNRGYELVAAHPMSAIPQTCLPGEDKFAQLLNSSADPYIFVNDRAENSLAFEKQIGSGTHAVIKLANFGFIKMVSRKPDFEFGDAFLKPLLPVMQSLSIALCAARDRQALEAEIEERERVQRQLIGAKQEALSASRLKTEFLANVSHEIRTPLNAIIGFSALLRTEKLPGPQANKVKFIAEAGESLLTLVNDILDFSKIESGKMEIEKTEFDPVESLEKVADMLGAAAVKNNVQLTIEGSENVNVKLLADKTRIEQILVNLSSNAVKFTKDGKVTLRYRLVKSARRGRAVLTLTVADTGIGIEASKIETIFEAFRQADASSTRKYGGTGLGLAICRRLAELMGGRIKVYSQVGKGSEFVLKIPVQVASEARVTTTDGILDQLAFRPEGPALESVSVLVVEDNQVNQMITTSLLTINGAQVQVADNGEQAIQMVESSHFDVILMDCQMPVMDGYEATKQIRHIQASKKLQSTPIIALTAHAFQSDRDKCLSVGMNGHLAKPVDPQKLVQAVKVWTANRDRRVS